MGGTEAAECRGESGSCHDVTHKRRGVGDVISRLAVGTRDIVHYGVLTFSLHLSLSHELVPA